MKDNSKFGSSQSLIDAVNEVLKGGQKKLDKNHNGKLDGEDFKKLRGENEVDEVAASKTQQRAAGAALATQRGEYDGGKKGGAINRMSAMKPSDLMKIAGTKTKELPMRKEDAEQADEGAFSSGALKASEKFKREAKKIQSTGTYIGKDGKGVFTSKTVNGKEISRTYEKAEQADEGFKSAKMEINRLKAARAKNDAIAVAFNRKEKEKDTTKELPMRKEDAVMKAIKSMKAMKAKESTSY